MIRNHRESIRKINCEEYTIGGGSPLVLIAGPCVVEDFDICNEIAKKTKKICEKFGVNYIFKASFDKANKLQSHQYRGPGLEEGLSILKKVKEENQVMITTDVHEPEQCKIVAEVADVLQIPSLLSKQIDLVIAACKTGKPVNIKKGQFNSPWELNNLIRRLTQEKYHNLMITERGNVFGYQMMVSDMRCLQIISNLIKIPTIFDGSHTVHGNDYIKKESDLEHREFILPLVRSAIANGVDGIFLETHPEPEKALSDSIGTFQLDKMEKLVKEMVNIDNCLIDNQNDD